MVDNELKLVIVPDFGRFQSELKKLGGQMENFGITGSKNFMKLWGLYFLR